MPGLTQPGNGGDGPKQAVAVAGNLDEATRSEAGHLLQGKHNVRRACSSRRASDKRSRCWRHVLVICIVMRRRSSGGHLRHGNQDARRACSSSGFGRRLRCVLDAHASIGICIVMRRRRRNCSERGGGRGTVLGQRHSRRHGRDLEFGVKIQIMLLKTHNSLLKVTNRP